MLIDLLFFFFFFKQKTAYEMRISDWSSDVCSSDCVPKSEPRRSGTSHRVWSAWNVLSRDEGSLAPTRDRKEGSWWALTGSNRRPRSEEHKSELQSLMRISYAVFGLKKKKKKRNTVTRTSIAVT